MVETHYGVVMVSGTGLSTIPRQFGRSATEAGFVLNIMVVGRRGLGSSTLVNSLFSVPLVEKDRPDDLTTTVNEMVEDDVRLKVSMTCYHGADFSVVERFIEQRNREYYENEQGLSGRFDDRRVHVCLFVIPADRMLPQEIEGMKSIAAACNLIPVITKADVFTAEEQQTHREKIHRILVENDISIFKYRGIADEKTTDLPGIVDTRSDLPGSQYAMPIENQSDPHVPESDEKYVLTTIASDKTYDFQGKIIRGRKYRWGFIDISNELFSDFQKLQRILIQTNYEDLLWKTDTVFYNAFRRSSSLRENASDEEAQELLRTRLCRLQTQMEETLEKKHKGVMDELRREECEASMSSVAVKAEETPSLCLSEPRQENSSIDIAESKTDD